MKYLEEKKNLLKAIKNALANMSLESDCYFNKNNITEEEIEEICKKLVIKNGKV